MDGTSEDNLKTLRKVFADSSQDLTTRRIAYRSFNGILGQMKDRTLTKLRWRLAKAHIAGDSAVADRLTMMLTDYANKNHALKR